MSAIKVIVENGHVELSYEEKTPENIGKRLNQLKQHLGVTWYGVAKVFNMKPSESSVRLFARWQRDPSQASYQEMPENSWKLLLALLDGQDPLN
ncbi:hypothetical protein [Vibrio vulnificus]|uniref:hypothetical protein n=1 Tax=Vibrio vulnificus TaxID=672 RepID=UPI001023B3D9|nr:hypothetical protein [Vibrio vulnificus]RZQ33204.1 hypothetical protein D8T38_18345 [Vibrio vulnificus]